MICISVRIRTEPPKSQASQPLTNLSQASHQPLRREASRTLWESLGASASLRRSHSINTDTHAIANTNTDTNTSTNANTNTHTNTASSLEAYERLQASRKPLTSFSQAFREAGERLVKGLGRKPLL